MKDYLERANKENWKRVRESSCVLSDIEGEITTEKMDEVIADDIMAMVETMVKLNQKIKSL